MLRRLLQRVMTVRSSSPVKCLDSVGKPHCLCAPEIRSLLSSRGYSDRPMIGPWGLCLRYTISRCPQLLLELYLFPMRVPLSWLAEYVPLRLPPSELAHRLTMAGIETTYTPGASAEWDHVSVGHVLEVKPHPNADRLRLVTVDLGTEQRVVVCGAPNVAEGQRIAFASVGARLQNGKTGEPMELTAATIRGVLSEGMVCSAKELGLGEDHAGILVLPADAPIGQPLAEYMPDDVLEIEVTANRGDCLSMLGVAHEVAAITGTQVTEPPLDYRQDGPGIDQDLTVLVEDPELCYRYTATIVQGVSIGPSPEWLQRRLEQAGQRPINNVVDVTNYVMLEYGQPLHAFDLARVHQKTVVVRPARAGEKFTTLDGVEHTLRPPMLLIADVERAIGIAGVMGGLNSEMTEATTGVLLESATFNAINTRRTAQALHLRTEASTRFEKGLNPELAMRAVQRATRLILETAGGVADRGVADNFPGSAPATRIRLSKDRMRRVLGIVFPWPQVASVLAALGFTTEPDGDDALLVMPPYWRTDVEIEEDLVEEVARTIGYDAIPAEALAGQVPTAIAQPERDLREEVRDLLVRAGMQETISYSLVSSASLEQVRGALDQGTEVLAGARPLRVANPMSHEQEYLRTSLRGAILRSAATGLRQPPGGVALFEVGRVYLPDEGGLPEEREMAVGVYAGPRGGTLWDREQTDMDFFDAKGTVESLMERLGVRARFERAEDSLLHPGRTARVMVDGLVVGVMGELHPRAIAAFDFPVQRVALFELDVARLAGQVPWLRHHFQPFSRYPLAVRDLALLVDESVPADRLRAIIESDRLVVRATLFDLFSGQGFPEGKKSLAYRLELQSPQGTLDTDQVSKAVTGIVKRLERETGATLRG